MKKSILIPLSILLGFAYVIVRYFLDVGYLSYYFFFIMLFGYIIWLLMVGLPALAAFAFQVFTCHTSKSILVRLIPTAVVLAIIVYECVHPFYGVYLNLVSLMLGLTPYLAIPVVLLGLLLGWRVKVEK